MIEITPIGFIIIPLSFVLFFASERLLYSLLIFVIPFSATSVINISLGDKSTGVMVFTYISILWITRKVFDILITGRLSMTRYQKRSTLFLISFLLIAIVSLVMPILLDGKVELFESGVYFPLHLTMWHITRVFYLLIGILFVIFFVSKNNKIRSMHYTLKMYLSSSIFVCVWGWLQRILYYIGKPYPVVFNNSISPSAQGYITVFEDVNLKRISSVAVEPSILAQFLLTVLPFVLVSVYLDKPILSKNADRLSLFLIISVMAISTSTTGYVGFVVMVVIAFYVLRSLRLINLSRTVQIFLVLFLLLTLVISIIGINNLIKVSITTKFESFSFRDRLNSIITAFNYFKRYPLLGLGWGSVTSHDLFVRTLANVGVLGFIVLISALAFILRGLNLVKKHLIAQRNYRVVFFTGALIAYITLIIVCMFSDFPYVFGHFWFTLGMAIANTSIQMDDSRRLE
jgi:hypothetical protein